MIERVRGWSPHVERSLKEVLYRFLEEVHCTRAALYLRAPSGGFLQAVRFGFGRSDAPPLRLEAASPLVVAAAQCGGLPIAVNAPDEMPQLSETLRATGVSRMLLAPVLLDGRLIGLVDAREKGGQLPFGELDRERSAEIATALSQLIGELGLADRSEPSQPADEAGDAPADVAASAAGGPDTEVLDRRALVEVVAAASQAVVRERLHAVAVTVVDGADAATVVLGCADSDEAESAAITTHQAQVLLAATGASPRRGGWTVEWRRLQGIDSEPKPSVIVSDVPLHEDGWSLVLSVVAGEASNEVATVIGGLRREVAAARELASLRAARRRMARRLLEPGERRYPDLTTHSMAVSRLCWRMAHAAGLHDDRAELAALAGLLHDVGMRELDYDRLYRLDRPGPEHRRVYRRHVLSGERVVRGIGLEAVADAIRHHHERWDGAGYPDRLAADRIPSLARMVHVAEVFDVLTSASSYVAPMPQEHAMATITAAAGSQFDPEMVRLLADVLP